MINGTNPKSPKFLTKLGILTGFIIEVVTAIFMKMTEAELQHCIGKKERIRTGLLAMFKMKDGFIEEKEQWRKFYQKHFSFELNFSDVIVLEKPVEGTWRLLIIAQSLTLNQVYDSMSKVFKSLKYTDDLDKSVTKNIRDTKTVYAIWVRDDVEPDEEYLGKSTSQADPTMTIGVTLLERIIMEMAYFDETGKHLDINGATFCTGSRYTAGYVPFVDWNSSCSAVRVNWYRPDHYNAEFGLRSAVSL